MNGLGGLMRSAPLLLAAAIALTSCSDSTAPRQLSGLFDLLAVNSQAVPVVVVTSSTLCSREIELVGGTLEFLPGRVIAVHRESRSFLSEHEESWSITDDTASYRIEGDHIRVEAPALFGGDVIRILDDQRLELETDVTSPCGSVRPVLRFHRVSLTPPVSAD